MSSKPKTVYEAREALRKAQENLDEARFKVCEAVKAWVKPPAGGMRAGSSSMGVYRQGGSLLDAEEKVLYAEKMLALLERNEK